jgi:hypothetical protein
MQLVPDKHFAAISRGEATDHFGSVFPDSSSQIGSDADVQCSISAAGQNADRRLLHAALSLREAQATKQSSARSTAKTWIASLHFVALAMTKLQNIMLIDMK